MESIRKVFHQSVWLQEEFLKRPYRVHGLLYLIFIAQGLFYDGPRGVALGLLNIIAGPDNLVTDYIYVGGLGAALVNVGLSGLLVIGALVLAKHEPTGFTMGTLGLVVGFAFFGKNPFNMWPIIMGGFLYSKVADVPYDRVILRSVLATCLAPAVTQLTQFASVPTPVGIILGIIIGLFIGFFMNPLAAHMETAHKNYNLYNVGFTAGILGVCLHALFGLMGADITVLQLWSSGYNVQLMIFLGIVSVYFILVGFMYHGEKVRFREYAVFHAADYDYFKRYREKAYVHMGIMGLACLIFMLVLRGEYSGPVIGAILSVVGFGAFGKALSSAAIVVSGAMLAAAVNWAIVGIPMNDRSFLVAALFSTCLSPLAKRFGIWWGLAAGFLHLTLATNVGVFHGGMNLYNNGFAGGLAAMVILPIIIFFNRSSHSL